MVRKVCMLFLFAILLSTSKAVAIKMDQETLASQRLAQWNINYASYLIDVGKYLDALDAYNTAFEVTPFKQTKLKVLLYKANLLATFLDAEKEAIDIYNTIIARYPSGEELALYRKGLLLFDMEKYKEAGDTLSIYLKKYPRGRYRFQVEVLLNEAKKAVVPPAPPSVKIKKRPPLVRVLLYRKARSVTLQGRNITIEGKPVGRGSVTISREEIRGTVEISANSPIRVIVGNKYSKRVRGKIVLKSKKGCFRVINVLDIESYLWGVVPSESYPSWPLETLKAQAVASRTYAYYQTLHRKDWDYDLVDNEGDQAYKGIDRETKKTTTAVNETRGEILMEGDRPILAMYTANSGGYTADAGYIFKLDKRYLVAKPDPLSLKGKMSRWKRKYSLEEIGIKLRRIGIPVRGLENIKAAEKSPSGRIVKVKIIATNFSKIYRTRTTLGRALRLPEILFSIENRDGYIIFKGKGWGHGVGYSQWGSAEMGMRGYTYRQILKFYYPTTKIVKLW